MRYVPAAVGVKLLVLLKLPGPTLEENVLPT